MTVVANFRHHVLRTVYRNALTTRSRFTPMKNPYVIRTFGLGAVLALAISLNSSAIAGPGPQYWTQMEQIRAENAAKAKATTAVALHPAKTVAAVPTAKPADTPAMACPRCKTKVLEEFSFTNVSGKIAPHSTVIGKSHSCEVCSGVITKVWGRVTDEMNRTCPICAKAGPGCCTTDNNAKVAGK